jgi:hypothetical protein
MDVGFIVPGHIFGGEGALSPLSHRQITFREERLADTDAEWSGLGRLVVRRAGIESEAQARTCKEPTIWLSFQVLLAKLKFLQKMEVET